MHRDAKTGEKVLSNYENQFVKPDYDAMSQERRDALAICIKVGGLHEAISIYGFNDIAPVYLFHPGLKYD